MTWKGLYWVPVVAASVVGFVVGHSRAKVETGPTRRPIYYVDPMHPSYRSNKPGKAPDCGMDLTPVYAEEIGKSLVAEGGDNPAVLHIDPETQRLYGIRLARVSAASGQGTFRMFGRVAADETRVLDPRVTASEKILLDRVQVNPVLNDTLFSRADLEAAANGKTTATIDPSKMAQ